MRSQSQVYVSFDLPEYTGDISGLASVRLLEAINICNHKTKYFQACSSEIFGKPQESPQNENTLLKPVNPYGVAKLYAYLMTSTYRSTYDMFNCYGIPYSHESPLKGGTFCYKKNYKKYCKNSNKTTGFFISWQY